MVDQEYWAHPMYEGIWKSDSEVVAKARDEEERKMLSEKWGVTLEHPQHGGGYIVSAEDREKLNERDIFPKVSAGDTPYYGDYGDREVYTVSPTNLRVGKPKGYKPPKKQLQAKEKSKKPRRRGPGSRGGEVDHYSKTGKPVYRKKGVSKAMKQYGQKPAPQHAQNRVPHEYGTVHSQDLGGGKKATIRAFRQQRKGDGYHVSVRDSSGKNVARGKTHDVMLAHHGGDHKAALSEAKTLHSQMVAKHGNPSGAKKSMQTRKAMASSAGGTMAAAGRSGRKTGPGKAGGAYPTEQHESQKFSPGEASHADKQATRGAVSRMVHGAAQKVGQALKPAAKSTGIICPHCESGISKGYAVKALAMLAKSEGYDLGDELESLALEGYDEAGLTEEEYREELEAEKAVSGATNYVGNKMASHKGNAPGKGPHVGRHRAGGKQGVDRSNRPTNPVNEHGMNKSLSLPIYEGDAQLVNYGFGEDAFVSKSIEGGNLHTPVARNLRAEVEWATGESTPE